MGMNPFGRRRHVTQLIPPPHRPFSVRSCLPPSHKEMAGTDGMNLHSVQWGAIEGNVINLSTNLRMKQMSEGFPLEGKLSAEQTDEVSPMANLQLFRQKISVSASIMQNSDSNGATSSGSDEPPSPPRGRLWVALLFLKLMTLGKYCLIRAGKQGA